MPSLSSVFLTVFNMSITAGMIALLLLLLRPVLLRLPRIFAYLLWLPVFVRLLCPVSFTTIFSLFVLTDSGVHTSAPVAALVVQDVAPLASSMEWEAHHRVDCCTCCPHWRRFGCWWRRCCLAVC